MNQEEKDIKRMIKQYYRIRLWNNIMVLLTIFAVCFFGAIVGATLFSTTLYGGTASLGPLLWAMFSLVIATVLAWLVIRPVL